MTGRGEGYPSWPTTSAHDFYQSGIQAPVSGIFVPVPALGDVGGPLVIDARLQRIATLAIRITCEITDDQAASSDPREGVYYVFAKDPTDTMAGLPGSYQYDMTRNVPDTIGIGFSVHEVVPMATPYLLLMSRTTSVGEVRIRVA
jgi:hypothetical protein